MRGKFINFVEIGGFINFAEIGGEFINFVEIGGNMHHWLREMDAPEHTYIQIFIVVIGIIVLF